MQQHLLAVQMGFRGLPLIDNVYRLGNIETERRDLVEFCGCCSATRYSQRRRKIRSSQEPETAQSLQVLATLFSPTHVQHRSRYAFKSQRVFRTRLQQDIPNRASSRRIPFVLAVHIRDLCTGTSRVVSIVVWV